MRGTQPGGRHGSLNHVAETVIELDISAPWQPPEPPAPRRRLQARWVAVATVLAVTLGVLVAGGPRSGAGLLYSLDFQVLRAQTSGGRLFLARYQTAAPGPMIEARRASDGALLWEHSAEVQQQMFVAGPDVLILMSAERTSDGDSGALVVLDAATGRELWSRPGTLLTGTKSDVVIVEDAREVLAPTFTVIDPDQDPGINRVGTQPPRRFLGLSVRTGATVWDVTVAQGQEVDLDWVDPFLSRLDRIDVLSRSGQLTRRDARTGAVTATYQLDWSGAAEMLSSSRADGSGRVTDRVVLYPDGQRGAMVYDLATGRLLFRWVGEDGRGLFRCTDRLFCTADNDGLLAVDSATGERRWHLDGPRMVIGFGSERLLIGGFGENGVRQLTASGIVDGRTGTVIKQLTDWQLLNVGGGGGDRPLVWRPVDKRTAVLGELDPMTGTVLTFATAEAWFGNPECSGNGTILACVVVGGLSVWRLPNRH